jgi:tripartite-type tricarboxylate transporter receptor subunit TctC
VADLVGGQIDLAVTTVTSVAPMLASGRLKILGVSSRERVPLIKDVQTFAETNSLRGLEMMVWAVLFAPPGTPDAVVQKLNAVANQTLAQPAMKAMVAKLGAEVPPVWSPAQTKEFLAAQRKLYAQAIGRIQPE